MSVHLDPKVTVMTHPIAAPASEAYRMAQDGAVLVDVREPHEYAAGHAPGAVSLPLGQLGARHSELPKGERLLVMCLSGGRSAQAASILHELGYDVVNVAGGIGAWESEGLPVAA